MQLFTIGEEGMVLAVDRITLYFVRGRSWNLVLRDWREDICYNGLQRIWAVDCRGVRRFFVREEVENRSRQWEFTGMCLPVLEQSWL